MPYGDRRGPMGYGPRTGRGAGYCSGYSTPGFMNPQVPRMGMGRGRGFLGRMGGRGFGIGRGSRGGFRGGSGRDEFGMGSDQYYCPIPYYGPPQEGTYPEPSPEEEKTYLENVVKSLEDELKSIKDRLGKLSKQPKK